MSESSFTSILYEVDDGRARITLNRPERLNAISRPMLAELSAKVVEANKDPDTRCIVLTGAGRGFCAGLDLIDTSLAAFCWVVDFPMFEWDERESRWTALHHPFTAPKCDDPAALVADPGASLSRAYDMVLNGTELGGGSIRIHRAALQPSPRTRTGPSPDATVADIRRRRV